MSSLSFLGQRWRRDSSQGESGRALELVAHAAATRGRVSVYAVDSIYCTSIGKLVAVAKRQQYIARLAM